VRALPLLLAIVLAAACAPGAPGIQDDAQGEGDLTGGKADGEHLTPAEARLVLALVNDPTVGRETLVDEGGLTPAVTENIVKRRDGRDRQPGTDDDRRYDTLRELDGVRLVGDRTLDALLALARARQLVNGERTIATADGKHVRVHIHGEGPPCLVMPGGPGMEWIYLRMPALETFMTLVYVEPAGTGASDALDSREDYTLARSAADLEAVRVALGLERTWVLGHSAGGFAVQRYVLDHPDHLAGVILYDTSPVTDEAWEADMEASMAWFEGEPWYQDALAALEAQAEATTAEEWKRWDAQAQGFYFFDYTGRKDEIDAYMAPVDTWLDPLYGPETPEPFDTRRHLDEITAPTLVIVGARDFICSTPYAELFAEKIPDAELVTLEASGHFGHFEEPEAFTAAVADFVGRH
jgi:pimeloyl-ACP methyl ester carboxylesterase